MPVGYLCELMSGSLVHVIAGVLICLSIFPCSAQEEVEELMPLEKLPPSVNTDNYDEGAPVLSLDGHSLYFTRSGSPDFERTLIKEGRDMWVSNSEDDYKVILSSIRRSQTGILQNPTHLRSTRISGLPTLTQIRFRTSVTPGSR